MKYLLVSLIFSTTFLFSANDPIESEFYRGSEKGPGDTHIIVTTDYEILKDFPKELQRRIDKQNEYSKLQVSAQKAIKYTYTFQNKADTENILNFKIDENITISELFANLFGGFQITLAPKSKKTLSFIVNQEEKTTVDSFITTYVIEKINTKNFTYLPLNDYREVSRTRFALHVPKVKFFDNTVWMKD